MGATDMATGQLSDVLRHLRGAALQGGGMTDGQLLECFVTHRDEAAFEALVRRHGPMVLGVCRRVLRNHHDAEDAFQATFLVLARKATAIGRRELLGNWLYGTAYRAALEAKAARRRVKERQVSAMAEPEAAAQEEGWRELRPVLDQELSRLPDKYRVPVVLCDLEGRTLRDVARQLGLPAGTLSGRLTTARRRLARRLARHGFVLSAGALAAALSPGAASACVPSPLVASTVQGATLLALGQAAPGVISDQVIVLTEGVMKAMFLTKLKAIAALAVALLVGSTVIWGYAAQAEEPPEKAPRPAARDADQPKEAAPVRKDLNGDVLPPGALARLGGVRFRSVGSLHHLAVSPDGKTVAVAGSNHAAMEAICLLDLATGEEIRQFAGHKDGVKMLCMSPDGKTLASKGGDNRTRLWDVATGKERYDLPGASVIFSPDGEVLFTIAKGPTIRLLDAATGKELRSWEVPGGYPFSNVAAWALAPDGKILVTGRNDADAMGGPKNHAIYLWEVATGKEILKIAGPEDFVAVLAVSPDGKLLASGGFCPARLGPDGKLVVTAPKIHLWDTATGKEVRTWEAQGAVRQLIFSRDGKTLLSRSDGSEGTIRRWDVATGKESAKYRVPGLTAYGPVALLPDGKTLLAACGSGLHLLDLASGKEVRSPQAKGHDSLVYALSFTPDGKSLLSSGAAETLMWDVATHKIAHEFEKSGGSMARLSPDGKTLCKRGENGDLELWDVATRKLIRQLQAPKGTGLAHTFAFSPDGKTLVSGKTDGVRLYDVATGFYCDLDGIQEARFSPDGKTLGALTKEDWLKEVVPAFELWDVATRKRIRQFELNKLSPFEYGNTIVPMEMSPDGKLMAVGRDRAVCLLDVATGKLTRTLKLNGMYVCLAFSPDGKTLATGGRVFERANEDHDVHLWDTATGEEIGTLKGHRGGVTALVYSPDGKALASACTDSTILIWDVSRAGKK
jgi:RNA polymerase sigma factor (sigma-70 family)